VYIYEGTMRDMNVLAQPPPPPTKRSQMTFMDFMLGR
jgi:hypothetical protein